MSTALSLAMQISANTAGLASAVKDVEKQLRRMEEKTKATQEKLSQISFFTGVQALGTAFDFVASGITNANSALSYFVGQSSAATQELQKLETIFGDSSDAVVRFSETAGDLGLSVTQAQAAASGFGNMFTSFGASQDSAAAMSVTLTQIAADLAAFNNTSPDQAIFAIGSAMRGEYESAKKYGLAINETVLKQKALELGFISTKTEALDPLQKSMASYYVLLEQTKNAQGQAAREGDQLTIATSKAAAVFSNLAGTIGNVFEPIYLAIYSAIKEAEPAIQEFSDYLSTAFGRDDAKSAAESWEFFKDTVVSAITIAVGVITNFVAILDFLYAAAMRVSAVFNYFAKVMGIDLQRGFAIVIGGLSGAAAAFVAYNFSAIAASIANFGLAVSFKALLRSIPILGTLLVLVGMAVAYFADYAFGAYEVADASGDIAAAQEQAKKDMEENTRAINKQVKEMKAGTTAAKEFAFSIKEINNETIAESSVSGAVSKYKKLASDLGTVEAVPAKIAGIYDELNKRLEAYNSGENRSAVALASIQIVQQRLSDAVQEELDRRKAISDEIESQKKYLEDAAKLVDDLYKKTVAPRDQASIDYFEREKQIAAYRKQMLEEYNRLMAEGQVAAAMKAKQEYQKTFVAQRQNQKELQKDTIAAYGFGEEVIEKQERTVDKLAKAFQLFRDPNAQLTGDQQRNVLQNVLGDMREFYSSITSGEPANELIRGADIRTEEGMKEFFRIATNKEDPVLEENKKQLKELAEIKRYLMEQGIQPVSVLGGAV